MDLLSLRRGEAIPVLPVETNAAPFALAVRLPSELLKALANAGLDNRVSIEFAETADEAGILRCGDDEYKFRLLRENTVDCFVAEGRSLVAVGPVTSKANIQQQLSQKKRLELQGRVAEEKEKDGRRAQLLDGPPTSKPPKPKATGAPAQPRKLSAAAASGPTGRKPSNSGGLVLAPAAARVSPTPPLDAPASTSSGLPPPSPSAYTQMLMNVAGVTEPTVLKGPGATKVPALANGKHDIERHVVHLLALGALTSAVLNKIMHKLTGASDSVTTFTVLKSVADCFAPGRYRLKADIAATAVRCDWPDYTAADRERARAVVREARLATGRDPDAEVAPPAQTAPEPAGPSKRAAASKRKKEAPSAPAAAPAGRKAADGAAGEQPDAASPGPETAGPALEEESTRAAAAPVEAVRKAKRERRRSGEDAAGEDAPAGEEAARAKKKRRKGVEVAATPGVPEEVPVQGAPEEDEEMWSLPAGYTPLGEEEPEEGDDAGPEGYLRRRATFERLYAHYERIDERLTACAGVFQRLFAEYSAAEEGSAGREEASARIARLAARRKGSVRALHAQYLLLHRRLARLKALLAPSPSPTLPRRVPQHS
eukprot:tig00021589_g22727.t1